MIIRTVIVILLFIASLNFVNAEEHSMEYFVLSPHIITEEGKPTKGAILDYFNRYIIPRLSKPITWGAQETPLARILVMLKEGEIPFIPFLLKKPERENYLHYSKKPYFITRPAILVRSDFPLKKIENINDLSDFKIAFFQHGAMPPAMLKAGIIIKRVAGKDAFQRMMVMLKYERIDAIFDYQVLTLNFIKKQFDYSAGQVLPLPLPVSNSYFVASKKAISKEYFSEFEAALLAAPPYNEFVNDYIENYQP